jgi:succinate dehydrogenase / fumarate reductase, cytochrome b subunit
VCARHVPLRLPQFRDFSHWKGVRHDPPLPLAWGAVATTRAGNTGGPLVKGTRGVRTTIALKILMAVSGVVFIMFVLLHMYGNLQAFAGHDAFNEYAEHLRTFGQPMLPYTGLLWVIRVVLVVSLIVHVYAAVVLWRRARAARTVQYEVKKHTGAIVASRLMRWGGVTILVFLVWHLLNFTVGKVNASGGPTDDPYNLLVDTFSIWWITLIYLVAMAMLGAHLHHGIWSAAQTLGLTSHARSRWVARQVAFTTAVIITGGFCLVPIFVLAGVIEK